MNEIDEILSEMDDTFDPDECDYITAIIEGGEEVNVYLTHDQVILVLKELKLEPEDISLNQPIITGTSAIHGTYLLYKGGNKPVKGWVTDNYEFATKYGKVKTRQIIYKGQTTNKWSVVGDWDGSLQLVPPGPCLRLIYDNAFLLLI